MRLSHSPLKSKAGAQPVWTTAESHNIAMYKLNSIQVKAGTWDLKMINYLPLINKGQVKLRLVAESWGWSDCVPCFLCLLMWWRPRCEGWVWSHCNVSWMESQNHRHCSQKGLRNDRAQPPHFIGEYDGAQRSEVMRNHLSVQRACPECQVLPRGWDEIVNQTDTVPAYRDLKHFEWILPLPGYRCSTFI